jgi:polyisoprenoid-binding protein YceI
MPQAPRRPNLAAAALVVLGLATATGLTDRAAAAAETFAFDKAHTEILFSYSHLGNSRAYGSFRDFDGTIVLDRDDPSRSNIDLTIAAASVDTGVAPFDTHLKSSDFFAADTFPEIRFVSTAVEPTSESTAAVTGELTIKEQTREVVLDVTLNYLGEHQLAPFVPDYADTEVAGFSATATLLRSDFGLDMLVPLVGDEVSLVIETELLRPMTSTN